MLKTAPRTLLPAALLSALVGLAGCHISIGSGSSNPNTVHGKPAHHSSSSSSRAPGRTSKPLNKSTKPVSEPDAGPTRDTATDDKTSDGPHRDQTDTTDPKRTEPASDPVRTKPASSEPTRQPKHIGGHAGGDAGGAGDAGDAGAEDAGGAGAKVINRPGSVVAPTKDAGGGTSEVARPGSLTAPK